MGARIIKYIIIIDVITVIRGDNENKKFNLMHVSLLNAFFTKKTYKSIKNTIYLKSTCIILSE